MRKHLNANSPRRIGPKRAKSSPGRGSPATALVEAVSNSGIPAARLEDLGIELPQDDLPKPTPIVPQAPSVPPGILIASAFTAKQLVDGTPASADNR
jgi:hypothetical protein